MNDSKKLIISGLITKLKQAKDAFFFKNSLHPDAMVIIYEELIKGNPMAIANVQWMKKINKLYYKKVMQIHNNLKCDMNFNEIEPIPYSAKTILKEIYEKDSLDHLVIVELYYDPNGKDFGNEFLVLFNPTDKDISIENWTVEIAGSYFKKAVVLNGVIKSGNYYAITGDKLDIKGNLIFNLNMQNGGRETDGVRIVNNFGHVVDTVLYDNNNKNNLKDDENIGISFAPDTNKGSLIRKKKDGDFIDTDNSFDDFEVNLNPDLSVYL